MQQASAERARRQQQARWQALSLRAVQLHEDAKKMVSELHKGWTWVEAAEGEERERREEKWLKRLGKYERVSDELRETERALRDVG
jgi:hypothetical protein